MTAKTIREKVLERLLEKNGQKELKEKAKEFIEFLKDNGFVLDTIYEFIGGFEFQVELPIKYESAYDSICLEVYIYSDNAKHKEREKENRLPLLPPYSEKFAALKEILEEEYGFEYTTDEDDEAYYYILKKNLTPNIVVKLVKKVLNE